MRRHANALNAVQNWSPPAEMGELLRKKVLVVGKGRPSNSSPRWLPWISASGCEYQFAKGIDFSSKPAFVWARTYFSNKSTIRKISIQIQMRLSPKKLLLAEQHPP